MDPGVPSTSNGAWKQTLSPFKQKHEEASSPRFNGESPLEEVKQRATSEQINQDGGDAYPEQVVVVDHDDVKEKQTGNTVQEESSNPEVIVPVETPPKQ